MYTLRVEQSFDSAHFLAGYKGKCGNIHGHRWRVEVEVSADTLIELGEHAGMVVDFSILKSALRELVDPFDHVLIIETGTMRVATLEQLQQDGFAINFVDFRPTAENFAAYFYRQLKKAQFAVRKVIVYETPTNSAIYEE
jgi:6-pyruvoyltetrahydropterin/6-carboxytetrahydropterin synthase